MSNNCKTKCMHMFCNFGEILSQHTPHHTCFEDFAARNLRAFEVVEPLNVFRRHVARCFFAAKRHCIMVLGPCRTQMQCIFRIASKCETLILLMSEAGFSYDDACMSVIDSRVEW